MKTKAKKKFKPEASACCGQCHTSRSWTSSEGTTSVVLQPSKLPIILHVKSITAYPSKLKQNIESALAGINADVRVIVTTPDVEISRTV